ncbi:hypothetical protein CBG25_09645, partial [Arsenophonus sp. ENCA]|uniref:hypothetical protein n=1 Tax=Arsenophonus sp. ENCA TaxID=1987579 RepID=UPI000BC6534B
MNSEMIKFFLSSGVPCGFRVTVLLLTSGYIPLPRPFARVARSLGCVERWGLSFKKISWFF